MQYICECLDVQQRGVMARMRDFDKGTSIGVTNTLPSLDDKIRPVSRNVTGDVPAQECVGKASPDPIRAHITAFQGPLKGEYPRLVENVQLCWPRDAEIRVRAGSRPQTQELHSAISS